MLFSDLGREQLIALEGLDIEEMHDRFIGAEAVAASAVVITKDEILQGSAAVATVW